MTDSVSKRPQHVPRFDWEEARRRYAGGDRVAVLAAEYGVSLMAVYRILKPATFERMAENKDDWQRNGTCVGCGARATRRAGHVTRCVTCAAIAQATSVRDEELHCSKCDSWKPDDDFSSDHRSLARRGRRRYCRACMTLAKREWRAKYPERAKAANQRDNARRRAAA